MHPLWSNPSYATDSRYLMWGKILGTRFINKALVCSPWHCPSHTVNLHGQDVKHMDPLVQQTACLPFWMKMDNCLHNHHPLRTHLRNGSIQRELYHLELIWDLQLQGNPKIKSQTTNKLLRRKMNIYSGYIYFWSHACRHCTYLYSTEKLIYTRAQCFHTLTLTAELSLARTEMLLLNMSNKDLHALNFNF